MLVSLSYNFFEIGIVIPKSVFFLSVSVWRKLNDIGIDIDIGYVEHICLSLYLKWRSNDLAWSAGPDCGNQGQNDIDLQQSRL